MSHHYHQPGRKKKRPCETCLWHWPEVHGGEGYRCYNIGSAYYREESSAGCTDYETRVSQTKIKQFCWGDQVSRPCYGRNTKGTAKPAE